jgi:hypothetical protein
MQNMSFKIRQLPNNFNFGRYCVGHLHLYCTVMHSNIHIIQLMLLSFCKHSCFLLVGTLVWIMGYLKVHLVEALRFKMEGRMFDSQWGHWDFSLT